LPILQIENRIAIGVLAARDENMFVRRFVNGAAN
jgi:hypothetical protein